MIHTIAPSDDQLFADAMDLLISTDRTWDDPTTRARVVSWRAQSPRHDAIWREVMEIDAMSGAVMQVTPKSTRPNRRAFILGGVAVGGIAVAGSGSVHDIWTTMGADYATRRAQVLPIRLPDGNEMSLGPRSHMTLDFTPSHRHITSFSGMAFMTLRPESLGNTSPLVLSIGDHALSATDAQVEINKDADEISVAVSSGSAAITGTSLMDALTLSSGQRVKIDTRTAQAKVSDMSPDQIGLWREGMISADDETVASVVAKVARWHEGRVVLTNAALGRQSVSGIYNLGNTGDALQSIVAPYGGHVRQIGPFVTFISAG